MKLHELKKLTDTDLKAQLSDAEGQLRELKFHKTITPLENPLRMRNLRREIARIKTLLNERQAR
ncbi:MAG: 50S ribosomal protein L29 [Bacteroidetes bacterium]|nr:50S ribosomal protein L29 [Bacteroidota bacterium]